MLTKPNEGTFNKLTLKINAGPNEDALDSFPIPFTFNGFAIDSLTDEDVDGLVQIVVNRIVTDHPDYIVFVEREWSGGTYSEPRDILHTPPVEPQPGEQP